MNGLKVWFDCSIEKLAGTIGSTEDALLILLSILTAYPIALFHRYLLYGKSAFLQHAYFILCGFSVGYINFGLDFLHSTVALLVTYTVLKTIGGTCSSVIITFVFNMGYLLAGYYVSATEQYDIKWTMPQCILVLRLIGLAFDIYDGQAPIESLSKYNQKVALKEVPSLLEIAGCVYFPASFLVGPQFPMKRYLSFVAGTLDPDCSGRLPDCMLPGLIRAATGVLYLVLFQFGSLYYSDSVVTSEQFTDMGFVHRCWFLGMWAHIVMYKYVSIWLLSEGACILTGLTYNGKGEDGRVQWDGCTNVNLITFEGALNFSNDYVNSFNVNTNFWMLNYIYKRLRFLGNKYYSQFGVLLFLAFWHGIHSGYFMCFFMEFVCVAMEKDLQIVLKRNETALLYLELPGVKQIKLVILKLYTIVFMGYCIAPLSLLVYEKWWRVYVSVYFYAHAVWMLWPLYRPVIMLLLPPAKVKSN